MENSLRSTAPLWRHQDIVFGIVIPLRSYFERGGGGYACFDVEFALTDNRRVRPDVWVLLGEKARQIYKDKVPIPGAPDIAIEVITPTERTAGFKYAGGVYYLSTGLNTCLS